MRRRAESRKHELTVDRDLRISATCVDEPASAVAGPSCLASQMVQSVRKVNEGPRAGFRVVDGKTDTGL